MAPLLEGDGVTGWIAVAKDDPAAAPEEELRLLAAFSYQASVALRKARLYWQQLEAAEIANALLDASRELATADSPEAVLNRAVEVTARVLGTDRASLWIQAKEAPHDLVPRAWFGGELDELRAPIPAERAEKWLQTDGAVPARGRAGLADQRRSRRAHVAARRGTASARERPASAR